VLERMRRIIEPELNGELPFVKINWYHVYLVCTDVLEALGKQYIAEKRDRYRDLKHGVLGDGEEHIVQLLQFIDEEDLVKESKAFSEFQTDKLQRCKEAFETVLQGRLYTSALDIEAFR